MTSPSTSIDVVIFELAQKLVALPLAQVKRVVQAVYVTPVPGLGGKLLGVINVEGQVCPVVNVRAAFDLPPKPVELDDQMAIVDTAHGAVAMLFEGSQGVIRCQKANNLASSSNETLLALALVDFNGELVVVLDTEKCVTDKDREFIQGLHSDKVAGSQ